MDEAMPELGEIAVDVTYQGNTYALTLVWGTGKWSILAGKELVLFINGTVSTILNNICYFQNNSVIL